MSDPFAEQATAEKPAMAAMAPRPRPRQAFKNTARPRTMYLEAPSYLSITDSDLEPPSPKPSETSNRQHTGGFKLTKLSEYVCESSDSDSDAPSPKKRKLDRAPSTISDKPRLAPTREGAWLKAAERRSALFCASRTTTTTGKSKDTAEWVLSQLRKASATSTSGKNLAASTMGGKAAKVGLEIGADGCAFVVDGLEAPAAMKGQRTASEGGTDASSVTLSSGTLEHEDGDDE